MPKQKTKRAATKRLKMSATGKIMRTRSGKRHLNACKTRQRKRNLRGTIVAHESDQPVLKRMLSTY